MWWTDIAAWGLRAKVGVVSLRLQMQMFYISLQSGGQDPKHEHFVLELTSPVWCICLYDFSFSNLMKSSFWVGAACWRCSIWCNHYATFLFPQHIIGQMVTSFLYFSDSWFTFVLLQRRRKQKDTEWSLKLPQRSPSWGIHYFTEG